MAIKLDGLTRRAAESARAGAKYRFAAHFRHLVLPSPHAIVIFAMSRAGDHAVVKYLARARGSSPNAEDTRVNIARILIYK